MTKPARIIPPINATFDEVARAIVQTKKEVVNDKNETSTKDKGSTEKGNEK